MSSRVVSQAPLRDQRGAEWPRQRVANPRPQRHSRSDLGDNVVDLRAARRARLQRHDERTWHLEDGEVADLYGSKPNQSNKAIQAGVDAAAQTIPVVKCLPCHWGLYVLSLLLTVLSVPVVYSASTAIALDHHGRADFFFIRQVGFVSAGLLVLVAGSRVSAAKMRGLVWVLYLVALLGLLAIDFTPLGMTMGGVRRWLRLGPLPLQFSELAKIALIGVLADLWSRGSRPAAKAAWPWLVSAALALPIIGLVFIQPHLSAALLLLLMSFGIAFYAGAAWRQMFKIVVVLALLAGSTMMLCKVHQMPFLKTYQQDRIAAHFASSGGDQRGANYQALQGQRALMRGGIFGTGPGGSLFKQGHLPAPHTDFILAVIGEEWGLIGMLALLTVYGLIIFFCFQTGHGAGTTFEALVCSGVGTLLAIQVVCNAGVVTGVLPVTGMPLPLLSYGGSGLICTLLGLGLVLSVSRRYGCDDESSE